MDKEYFDVYPKIVNAGDITSFQVKALYAHSRNPLDEAKKIQVVYQHENGLTLNENNEYVSGFISVKDFKYSEGVFKIECLFANEAEYTFRVIIVNSDQQDIYLEFAIYALNKDLFELKPYKGDFHMHSYYSDGKRSPAYVAGMCRKAGFDFMALTDHSQYKPSLEARNVMEELNAGIRCFPGEEIHPDGNPVHIINFGGNDSVNDLLSSNEYRNGVKKRKKELMDIPENERHIIASTEWCYQKIHKFGGISLLCHPYWKPGQQFNVTPFVNDVLIKRNNFDAMEVLGGFYKHLMESNQLSIARYHEAQAQGISISPVGVSDTHKYDGTLLGWYYSIIFAESTDFQDLANGIRTKHSLAIEHVENEFPRVIGSFRLVKFAYFLIREFYPVHDKLCKKEGEIILSHLAGDKTAKPELLQIKEQIAECFTKYWKCIK